MLWRAVAARAAFVGAGALAGAGGTLAVAPSGPQEISLNLGDTLTPRFSIKTDAILKVVGTKIVAVQCGTGSLYLRAQTGARFVAADTHPVKVCGGVPVPTVNIVNVCFSPVESLQKYNLVQYDSAGRPKTLDARGDSMTRSWGCKDTIYLDTAKTAPASSKVGN